MRLSSSLFSCDGAGVAVMLTLMQDRLTAPSSSSPFSLSVLPSPSSSSSPSAERSDVGNACSGRLGQGGRLGEMLGDWDGTQSYAYEGNSLRGIKMLLRL